MFDNIYYCYIGNVIQYISNGILVKRYLDDGYSIFIKKLGIEIRVADPPNTFYEDIISEKVNGKVIVATPDDGWVGDQNERL